MSFAPDARLAQLLLAMDDAKAAAQTLTLTYVLSVCSEPHLCSLPATPNYPLEDPKYHRIETIRPFCRGTWRGAGIKMALRHAHVSSLQLASRLGGRLVQALCKSWNWTDAGILEGPQR